MGAIPMEFFRCIAIAALFFMQMCAGEMYRRSHFKSSMASWEAAGMFLNTSNKAAQQHKLVPIETRVEEGTTRQHHHERVAKHLRELGVDKSVEERLTQQMQQHRLAMWDPDDENGVEDVYMVVFDDSCTVDGGVSQHVKAVVDSLKPGARSKMASAYGFEDTSPKVMYEYKAVFHGFLVKLGKEALAGLLDDPCVKHAEQDYRIKVEPEVEKDGYQEGNVPWGLDQIDGNMDGRYKYENTGEGVFVYVVDTGIQTTHDEFQKDGGASRAVAGADFVDPGDKFNIGDLLGNSCGNKQAGGCAFPGEEGCTCGVIPSGMPACSGHGTHCAGTVAGRVVGVAKGATVVAVRVLNCDGSGTSSAVVRGMDYAVQMKRDVHPDSPTVISMSLGGARSSESYADPSLDPKYSAIAAAKQVGVTVVVAAGNSGVDADTRSPAHIDDAITVCASNINKQRAYFSCFGPGVDVCAPGYKVRSAVTGSDSAYEEYSGTSMATPHVAGVLALMLEHNSKWSVEEQTNELVTDCVEENTVEMLSDSNARDYCSPGETDDRCDAPGGCHGCTGQDKCAMKNIYEPGSGEGDAPCGWYSPNHGGTCVEKCGVSDRGNKFCYYGTCICYCGGKYCDATYLWGIWLQFCCRTYFAGCEPEVVQATPNKLTNLFGKKGKCAASLPHGSNPAPSPTPRPPPSPIEPTPTPPIGPTPRPPTPKPRPPAGECTDSLECCSQDMCQMENLKNYCCGTCLAPGADTSSCTCGNTPVPTPAPAPPRRRRSPPRRRSSPRRRRSSPPRRRSSPPRRRRSPPRRRRRRRATPAPPAPQCKDDPVWTDFCSSHATIVCSPSNSLSNYCTETCCQWQGKCTDNDFAELCSPCSCSSPTPRRRRSQSPTPRRRRTASPPRRRRSGATPRRRRSGVTPRRRRSGGSKCPDYFKSCTQADCKDSNMKYYCCDTCGVTNTNQCDCGRASSLIEIHEDEDEDEDDEPVTHSVVAKPLASQDTVETWVIALPQGSTDADIASLTTDMPSGAVAIHQGHPSSMGSSAVLILNASAKALRQEILDHPLGDNALVETDMEWGIEPDIEEDTPDVGDSTIANGKQLNPESWGLDRIDDRLGRDQSYEPPSDGEGAHVYVLDTGIRTTHNDFEGRAIPTLDATNGKMQVCSPTDTNCATDRQGHGTHCAGTVGGRHYGVAKGATLHAVKVLTDSGSGSFSWFIQAIDWVIENSKKPAIISASLGGYGVLSSVKLTIDSAVRAGVTVVVAAGNEGDSWRPNSCSYTPAHIPSAITVGATQNGDGRAVWSNIGSCLDIFAPGRGIVSAGVTSNTAKRTLSGTSMACPHVAGGIAIIRGDDPSLAPDDALQLMLSHATTDVVKDPGAGSPNLMLYTGSGTPKPPAPTMPPTPVPPTPPETWVVRSGTCTIDPATNCISSPNFPSEYKASDSCSIGVGPNFPQVFAVEFNTEHGIDKLVLNGVAYSGTQGPCGVTPSSSELITWSADGSTQGAGWKLCPPGKLDTLPPTPAPRPTAEPTAIPTAIPTNGSTSEPTTTPTEPPTTECTDHVWTIVSGPCTVNSDCCASSSGHPSNYRNNEICVLNINSSVGKPIRADKFETEKRHDQLTVNGVVYDGIDGPWDVIPTGEIRWSSDRSVTKTGWSLCLSPANVSASASNSASASDMSPTSATKVAATTATTPATTTVTTPATTTTRWRQIQQQGQQQQQQHATSALTTSLPSATATAQTTTFSTATTIPPTTASTITLSNIWKVESGDCGMDDTHFCITSPHYPQDYSPADKCVIEVQRNTNVDVESFVTEGVFDEMIVHDQLYDHTYSGFVMEFSPTSLLAGSYITWTTDSNFQKKGWKICPS